MRSGACLIAALIAGCANSGTVDVDTVLAHGNCQRLDEGVQQVSFDELAKLRGAEMLGFEQEAPAAARDLVLVAISRGEQPTAGYSLRMVEARREGSVLTVVTQLETPPKDAMLAQVITNPCLVVGLHPNGITRVRAVGEQGEVIGEVALSGPSD